MVEVGSTVGNYQVLQKVGQGAMGAVYLAQHPSIGKRVALKVIRPELSNDEEVLVRFFNEARAVTQIGHPNIIDVQDFGQTPEGESFIVMELLEGQTLGSVLQDGPLAIDRAVRIAIQVADGLAAAHARGIIHRDLKPDNVFLVQRPDAPDFVKILDFGLAKLTGPGALSHKTKTGAVLGTPHYMAPEASEGSRNVDLRADVYALGCILFQMVTGRVPFTGEGFGEVLVRHLREPPMLPSRLRPEIPPALEKIILHALAKKPEFRFASMVDFGKALRDPGKWDSGFDDHLMEPSISNAATAMVQSAQPIARVTPRQPQAEPQAKTVAAEVDVRNTMPLPMRATGKTPQFPTGKAPQFPTGKVPHAPAAPPSRGVGLALIAALFILGGAGFAVYRILSAPLALHVTSTPEGAELVIGGTVMATTPATLAVVRHTEVVLTLRKVGYEDTQRTYRMEHESTLDIALRAVVPAALPPPLPVPSPTPPALPPPTVAPAPTAAPPVVAVAPVAAHAAAQKHVRVHTSKLTNAPQFHPDGALLAPNF